MGSLFGYSGPRDDALLERMDQVLRHRGRGVLRRLDDEHGAIGYRSRWEGGPAHLQSGGVARDGSLQVAVAGWCTIVEGPREIDATAESLLALYRLFGAEMTSRLRGAFVLAVRDGATLHLVRDGAGVRTLFYGRHNGRLLFGVEAKAIRAAPGFPRRLRAAALAEYLTFSFTPGAATMLEEVYELPAGHRLTCDGAGPPQLVRYFRFEEVEQGEHDEDWYVERFREEHRRAVARRLPRGEPTAVFLSGGLDSSVVAADVARLHDRRVHTFAIHFGPQYPHELEFARSVARRCRTQHTEVLIEPRDFLPRLRKMIWHLDDPIGDPITMPNFELASQVAGDFRFAFNGEGGDPLFGGPKNVPMLMQHWYGGGTHDPTFRERAYLASYRRGYEELSRLLSADMARRIDFAADLESILTPFFRCERPTGLLDKLSAINIRLKGAHLILPKVERMTGAWGLVPLAPLFDERLIELSFAMPSRLKLLAGVEKIVMKRAYADQLPREVLQRPKSGMRVPVHYWFQGELRRYARKILDRRSVKQAGIFDADRVQQLLDYNIEEGPGRYGLRLWMLLTFEIWRRIVIEGEPV
ncbi:MAG: asparagine synthase-related protein [Pirellulaceae bacterium]